MVGTQEQLSDWRFLKELSDTRTVTVRENLGCPFYKLLHKELEIKIISNYIHSHFCQVQKSFGATLKRSWLRYYATSRKVAGSIPDEVLEFINWPNSSSRTMALRPTQPLRETSARNVPRRKGWPARKADNLTAICEVLG
jgi:hypothetical protein